MFIPCSLFDVHFHLPKFGKSLYEHLVYISQYTKVLIIELIHSLCGSFELWRIYLLKCEYKCNLLDNYKMSLIIKRCGCRQPSFLSCILLKRALINRSIHWIYPGGNKPDSCGQDIPRTQIIFFKSLILIIPLPKFIYVYS